MNPEVYRLLEMMKQLAPDKSISPDDHASVSVYQARHMAKLMVVLAEEQEKAAAKMERFAARLDCYTRWLIGLTVALLFIAAIQTYKLFCP